MGNSSSTSHSSMYDSLKNSHDEAYRIIEEAITLEEQERPTDAIAKYKEGVLLIDKCLNVSITFPENPDNTWEKLCHMIQKMKKTRGEVLTRVNCIQKSSEFAACVPPPSYEEAMSADQTTTLSTYSELATALNNIKLDACTPCGSSNNIIYSHDNVQMYFISPDGEVISTSQAETLNIILIEGEENQRPKSFLQIGNWIYPLVPGVSPCYRTDYGAFILPDVHMDKPGYSVGIILPSDADVEVYDLLENILHGIVNQVPDDYKHKQRQSSISGTISGGLITGAYYISQGLIKGAKKTGDLINYGTPKIINNISPNSEPTSLPPKLKKTLKYAHNASSTAASVTGFVADKIGLATSRLGQYLAPHIKKQGTRLLTSGLNLTEEEATNKVDDVFTVAAGALEGFSTVYRGLETSASILGQNLKNNSVKIIQHKYGNPAGELATDTLDTVGNVWHISNNATLLTPKGLVKHTAKQTGKALVVDRTTSMSAVQNNIFEEPSTSGYSNETNLDIVKPQK